MRDGVVSVHSVEGSSVYYFTLFRTKCEKGGSMKINTLYFFIIILEIKRRHLI